jgi:O-antigen ligase
MTGAGDVRQPLGFERAARAALALFVLAQPVFMPSLAIGGLRVIAADLAFAAVAVLLLASLAGGAELRWDRAFPPVAGWLAAMTLSALLSAEPRRSAFKLATEIYLLAIPVAVVQLVRSGTALKRLIQAWLAAAAGVAVLGAVALGLFFLVPNHWLLDYLLNPKGTLPPGPYPRFNLSFTHPAMLGLYMSVSIPILLGAARAGWVPRRLASPLLAAMLLAAAFSLTPGLGGLFLALGVWGWLTRRRERPWLARACLAAGMAGALAMLGAAAVTPYLHPTAPFLIHLPGVGTLAPSARLMFWIDAARTFLAHPLAGQGIGTDPVTVLYQNPSGGRALWHDAHETWLSVAAQTGIVGLLAFGWLSLHVVRRLAARPWPMQGPGAVRTALAIAWLQAWLWQGLVGSFEDSRCLWLLLGLTLAAFRLEEEDEEAVSNQSSLSAKPMGRGTA